MIIPVKPTDIPYDPLIRALCKTPFNNNPKGCFKRGTKDNCPPKAAMIDKLFDFEVDLMYIIMTPFVVGKKAEETKNNNSKWEQTVTYPDSTKKAKMYVADITARLKENNPEWPQEFFPPNDYGGWESKRAWYNPRHWQDKARIANRKEFEQFQRTNQEHTLDTNPEARGVNVHGLIMKSTGIKLNWQWPPPHHKENETFRISIAGILKE